MQDNNIKTELFKKNKKKKRIVWFYLIVMTFYGDVKRFKFRILLILF